MDEVTWLSYKLVHLCISLLMCDTGCVMYDCFLMDVEYTLFESKAEDLSQKA